MPLFGSSRAGIRASFLVAACIALLARELGATETSPRVRVSASLPAVPRHQRIRVAVCMVGQLARTEIKSKVENLIMANKRNADLHMFLVLSDGEAQFVNKATGGCSIAPKTLKEASAAFSRHVPTIVTEYKYRPYYVDIGKWPGYPEAGQAKKKRLQNHINQFRTWQICAKMVAKHELRTRIKYHAILRIRDNALILQPFNILDRLLMLSRQAGRSTNPQMYGPRRLALIDLPVVTKECASWSGVNDKVMLIPRMHMDPALSGMAEEFYLINANETRPASIGNPERYVKTILEKLEVPIFQEPNPANFPIADGRCEDGQSFCVVNQKKDCWPEDHTFPAKVCEQNYISNGWDDKKRRDEAGWKLIAERKAREEEERKAKEIEEERWKSLGGN